MAVRFDNNADYLYRSISGISGVSFTQCCWFYQTVDVGFCVLVAGHGGGFYSQIAVDSVSKVFVSSDTADLDGPPTSLGAWWFACRVTDTAGTDYLYSAAATSASLTVNTGTSSAYNAAASFCIGDVVEAPSYGFNGRIAHVKAWSAMLTQAEIEAERWSGPPKRTANLWAWYPFDESTYTSDYSGNGRTLTAAGTLTYEDGPPVTYGAPILVTQVLAGGGGTSGTATPAALGLTVSMPAATATGFAPISITGCQAWFDADDTASITSSAGAVSQWNDKSGSGRNVTQATGTNKPTTGTRTINGRNAIDFDGTTDTLVSANVTIAQPLTLFVVSQYDNVDTAARSMVYSGTSSLILRTNAGNWQISAATASLNGGADDASPHVFSAVFNGASSQLWVDGVSKVTGNPGTAGWAAQPITIGAGTWDGMIAEVVVYNSSLSTPDRQSVEAYLTTKWLGGTSGTATPAVLAPTLTLPAAIPQASKTVAPAVMVPTLTMPAATASASSAGTASPAVIAATITLPAATPLAGTVTAPSVIAATITMPAATASGAAAGTATPNAIAAAVALPAATASGASGGTASPAAITATVTMAQATPQASKTATPAAIALTVSMPAASATGASPGTAAPSPITATVTMPAATLQYGWVATPGAIVATVTMPAAAASNSKTATPAVIPLTVTSPAAATKAGATGQPNAIALVTVFPAPTLKYGYVVRPDVIRLAVALAAALGIGLEPDPNPVTVTVQDGGHTITVRVRGTTTTAQATDTTTTARQGR